MSFYTIQKNADGYELFLENGVFDENGIVKAREILVAECKGKLQKRHDEYWKARNDYIDEIVTLQDVLEYKLEKYGDNFPSGAINRRIDELNKKAEDERKESFRIFNILNSRNDDAILNYYGYKIVQVPIFSHCDENLLKEFV